MNDAALSGRSKNPYGKYVKCEQRQLAYNVYFKNKANISKTAALRQTSREVGISRNTMFDIVMEIEMSEVTHSPLRKRSYRDAYNKLDEVLKSMIRRHVHSCFFKNELPTCTNICEAIKEDTSLPPLRRTSLWRILKKN